MSKIVKGRRVTGGCLDFEYSNADWCLIENYMRPLVGFSKRRSHEYRLILRFAARNYVVLTTEGEFHTPDHAPGVDLWKSIRKSALELEQRLSEAEARSGGLFKCDGLRAALARVEKEAALYVERKDRPPTAREIRNSFYDAVLGLWFRIGGALRYSRHPTFGTLGGPCIGYFQACVAPVMQPPKTETIRKIIDRFRGKIGCRVRDEQAVQSSIILPY